MASNQPPQVGFNNNVAHRGGVFHIQTEDSGIERCHITTLLFADGGHIIKRERTDYRELVGVQDLGSRLRAKMRDQHKSMFVALRTGTLDSLLDQLFPGRLGPSAPQSSLSSSVSFAELGPISQPTLQVRSTSGVQTDAPLDAPGPDQFRSLETGTQRQPAAPCEVAGARPESVAPPSFSPEIGSCAENQQRLAATRVARRPGAPLRSVTPESLFGLHTNCEQSLDDVILSYICDDSDAAERSGS